MPMSVMQAASLPRSAAHLALNTRSIWTIVQLNHRSTVVYWRLLGRQIFCMYLLASNGLFSRHDLPKNLLCGGYCSTVPSTTLSFAIYI